MVFVVQIGCGSSSKISLTPSPMLGRPSGKTIFLVLRAGPVPPVTSVLLLVAVDAAAAGYGAVCFMSIHRRRKRRTGPVSQSPSSGESRRDRHPRRPRAPEPTATDGASERAVTAERAAIQVKRPRGARPLVVISGVAAGS